MFLPFLHSSTSLRTLSFISIMVFYGYYIRWDYLCSKIEKYRHRKRGAFKTNNWLFKLIKIFNDKFTLIIYSSALRSTRSAATYVIAHHRNIHFAITLCSSPTSDQRKKKEHSTLSPLTLFETPTPGARHWIILTRHNTYPGTKTKSTKTTVLDIPQRQTSVLYLRTAGSAQRRGIGQSKRNKTSFVGATQGTIQQQACMADLPRWGKPSTERRMA